MGFDIRDRIKIPKKNLQETHDNNSVNNTVKEKDDIYELIQEARKIGEKQLEDFKKNYNRFLDSIKDNEIFSLVYDTTKPLFEVTVSSLSNILNGNNIYNISDEEFLENRKELFKILIKEHKEKK